MWHHAQVVMMLIMPLSPLQKKDGGFAKNTGWSLGTRYRRILHLLCRIFIQTWSLFQTTHILLQQLYTFFPATRILNENPKYVKKKRFVILFHISCKESSSHHNTCMPGPILLHTAWPSRSLGCSKYQNGQHHCFYQTDVQLEKSKK